MRASFRGLWKLARPETTRIRTQRDFILPEDDAQAVALVLAIEETDRSGSILPLAERRAATTAAREAHPDGDGWLVERARALVIALKRQLPFLPRLLRFTSPVRGLLAPALVLAFVLGLLTNALGPEKRINVLALPLLGVIAWNLTVLAMTALRAVLPLDLGSGMPRFVGRLEAMARRLIDRLPRRANEGERDLLKQALKRYLSDWLPAVTLLASARGRRLLHASSLLLILGVVTGMYLRGVAFQYHATWESTFLSSAAVDGFLGTILAPASALLGVPVPSAPAIEGPAYGDAGSWIHLWAVTAALFVGVPRMLLAAAFSWRCTRRRRRLEVALPGAYLRRLLASVDTSERSLEVIPFSYRPPARAVEALKHMLYDLFGPRSEIRLRKVLDYGAEPAAVEPGSGRLRLVLFGLAQTPEVEVHGELLRSLRDELPDGQALLVVVDGSSYRQRLAGGGRVAERLAERRRAWDRVVGEAVAPGRQRHLPPSGGTSQLPPPGGTLEAVHVDLLEPDEEVLSRLLEAGWPAGVLEAEP